MTIIASAPVSADANLSTVDTHRLARIAAAHLDAVQSAWNRELHPSWCQNQYATGCGVHDSVAEWIPATSDRHKSAGLPAVGVSAHMDGTGQIGVALYVEGAKNSTDIIDVTLTPAEVRQLVDALQKAGLVAAADPQMVTRPEWPAGGAK